MYLLGVGQDLLWLSKLRKKVAIFLLSGIVVPLLALSLQF
jgi:hypothetical protein